MSEDAIRVLHVDDDPDIAELAATFLQRESERLHVETVEDVNDALDRVEAEEFDCIISDYDMPGRNGIEFLKEVRVECDLPFILYTGKGSEEVASEAISAGVTDYLQKQSGTGQYSLLANRVENAVSQHRAQTALQESEQRLSLFFEESPLGVIEWTEDFEVKRMNQSATDILGYTAGKLEGVSWERIVPDADKNDISDVTNALKEGQGGFHSVNQNLTRHGELITCEWHNRVVTDENDDVVAIFSKFQDITERREYERELEQYEAYLEGSNDIITVLDAEGTIQYQSPSITRVLGYEHGELVGENGFDYIHPDDVENLYETFTELVDTPTETVTVESRFQRADGTWCWLEIYGRNHVDDPDINGVITNNRDISERKEWLQDLRQEQERFQGVFEESFDAMVIANDNGQYIDVNAAATDLFGLSKEELLGRSVEDFAPKEFDVEAAWEAFRESDRERGEFPLVRADGSVRTVEYAASQNIVPGQHLSVLRDVTARREREEELVRVRDLLDKTERIADVGGWEIDTETNDLFLTEHLCELLGVEDEEQPLLDDMFELCNEEDRPALENAIDDALVGGEPFDVEVRVQSQNENTRWVRVQGVPERENGDVVSLRGAVQDITERKHHEEELQQQNERLEEFASVVSHDLRNPLEIATARLELGREECESQHLDEVERAHDRMNALIEELLTLARKGEFVQETESVGLQVLAQSSWDYIENGAGSLQVEDDGMIRADRSRLQQLFENLFRNSIEHGGTDVTVRVGTLPDGFYVADDGIGIPEEDRDNVFDPGFTTGENGTGFGLSIVKRMADAHGWTTDIVSTNIGTRIEVTDVEVISE